MSANFALIAPSLVAEVGSALIFEGRGELVPQLESGIIECCTYDELADAGYIYFVRPTPGLRFAKLAAPVAETIPFDDGFNIDVDHDGYIFGIEFLSRADFLAELRQANMFQFRVQAKRKSAPLFGLAPSFLMNTDNSSKASNQSSVELLCVPFLDTDTTGLTITADAVLS